MRRVLFVLLPCLTLASDPITIDSLFKRQIGLRSITTFSLLSSGNPNVYTDYPSITIQGDRANLGRNLILLGLDLVIEQTK